MNRQFSPDIRIKLDAFLATGKYKSEEEVLLSALGSLERNESELAAIQAGIDDMNAGRFRPWEEVDAEITAKFGFSDEAAGRTFSARELVEKAKSKLGAAASRTQE